MIVVFVNKWQGRVHECHHFIVSEGMLVVGGYG
jgi:hypothetical protein